MPTHTSYHLNDTKITHKVNLNIKDLNNSIRQLNILISTENSTKWPTRRECTFFSRTYGAFNKLNT